MVKELLSIYSIMIFEYIIIKTISNKANGKLIRIVMKIHSEDTIKTIIEILN